MLVPCLALTKGYFLPSFYLSVCPWLQESTLGHLARESVPTMVGLWGGIYVGQAGCRSL